MMSWNRTNRVVAYVCTANLVRTNQDTPGLGRSLAVRNLLLQKSHRTYITEEQNGLVSNHYFD